VDQPGFHHVALACRNLERSVSFYDKHLHMQVVHSRTDEHARVVWVSDLTQDFVLVLVEGPEPSVPMGRFAHFGIACQSRTAVDAIAAAADTDGCLIAGPKQSGELYWAFLRDPDGHQIEVSVGGNSISGAVSAARRARAKGSK
jgi:catechol 2,3-dioxygenase-like lactoylglutathione lyase family enzyme